MAAGRGAGAVRPDARPGAAHLRTNPSTHMDEEADDRATYKNADGAHIVPNLITDISTDDHTGTLGQLRADATTFTYTDAETYSYAFSHAHHRDADHSSTKPRAVAATYPIVHRSRRNRHGHGLHRPRALSRVLEDIWS